MANQDEQFDIEHFLQMYTYYGTVSWQILATFIAAALVVFFIPYAATTTILRTSQLVFFTNNGLAITLVGAGAVLFLRYQYFAHRWIHNQYCPPWFEDRISTVEWGQPYYPKGHKEPTTAWPWPLGFMSNITGKIPPHYHARIILAAPSCFAVLYAIVLLYLFYPL